jgi:hypothetical protein
VTSADASNVDSACAAAAQSDGTAPLGARILLDRRGDETYALYGTDENTVICQILGTQAHTLRAPLGPLPAGSTIAAPQFATASATRAADASTVSVTQRFMGRVAGDVRSVVMDVPGVGAVTATVRDGAWFLTIPTTAPANGQFTSSVADGWKAEIVFADGHQETVAITVPAPPATGPDTDNGPSFATGSGDGPSVHVGP